MIATFATRIKAGHDARGCTTWETWETTERDAFGAMAHCVWVGCRQCGVAILQVEG